MSEERKDERWCEGGDDRYGEFGVVGAEQADESNYDKRFVDSEEKDDDNDGIIEFSNKKLYGRDQELARCHQLYKNNMKSGSVFLYGYSGCGKGAMVEEFVKQVDQNPLYLRAKYDVMRTAAPFSALGALFDNVDEETIQGVKLIRDNLEETLKDDTVVLSKIFPGLRKTFASDDVSGSSCSVASSTVFMTGKKKTNKNQMMFALQSFFRALCTNPEHPLILFVDDLQWADMQSLELIQSLLTDPTLKHLFFFGAYRSNEVDEKHELIKVINEIEESSNQKIERIELRDLSIHDMGEFIADSLQLEVQDVQPLAQAIFTKTLGNAFSTRQALEQLVRKNALYYDNIAFGWSWNLKQEQLEELIADDLVEMVKAKILHLDEELQKVLIVASCTRATFDVETLFAVLRQLVATVTTDIDKKESSSPKLEAERKDKINALVALLDKAVIGGLVLPAFTATVASTVQEYRFAHDKIQEAAQSLIPKDNKRDFLFRIGLGLYRRALCPQKGEDWMYFAAAKHLNAVSTGASVLAEQEDNHATQQTFTIKEAETIVDDEGHRFLLARLNVTTAELSMDLLAFPAAIEFCKNGIKNLPLDENMQWSSRYYEFTLKLYTMGAEAEYGMGNLEQCERFCDRIMKHREMDKTTIGINDAIPVYKVYADILAGRGNREGSLDILLGVLNEIGVHFPTRFQRARAWWNLKQVKALYIPDEESIRDMSCASDAMEIEKMELLQWAGSSAFTLKKVPLYSMICCQSIQLMCLHGLTDGSASALASFANVLMHVYKDFTIAPRLAEMAITIADRSQDKFFEPQPLNTANFYILAWVRPIRTRLKYHQRTFESGMASGNIEGAWTGKVEGLMVQFFSAMPLKDVEAECRATIPEMRKMGFNFYASFAAIVWQVSLNFLGHPGNENTTILTGEALNEEEHKSNGMVKFFLDAYRSFSFVLFGDFEKGAEDALERGDALSKGVIGALFGMETFLRGMSLLVMARKRNHPNSRKYRKTGLKIMKSKDMGETGMFEFGWSCPAIES